MLKQRLCKVYSESSPTRFTRAARPGCKHHRARPSAATQSEPSRLRPLPSPQTKPSLALSTPPLLCHGQSPPSPLSLVSQRCWPSASPGSVRCPLSPGRSQECPERRAVGRHGRPRWWRDGGMRAARSRRQTLRTAKPSASSSAQECKVCDKCLRQGLRQVFATRFATSVLGGADLCRPGGAAAGRPMLSASSAPAPAPAPHKHINTTPSRQWQVLAAGGCVAYGAWSKRVGRRLDAPRRR